MEDHKLELMVGAALDYMSLKSVSLVEKCQELEKEVEELKMSKKLADDVIDVASRLVNRYRDALEVIKHKAVGYSPDGFCASTFADEVLKDGSEGK